jgi:hypothetical protein
MKRNTRVEATVHNHGPDDIKALNLGTFLGDSAIMKASLLSGGEPYRSLG